MVDILIARGSYDEVVAGKGHELLFQNGFFALEEKLRLKAYAKRTGVFLTKPEGVLGVSPLDPKGR